MEFIRSIFEHTFMFNAVVAGALVSVACGIVGSFVVTRRISYIAGSIAHSVLGGIGVARYLNIVHDWTWITPLYGALAAALVSALVIGLVSLRAGDREDTIIGAIWAIGMALGILFIALTPGYDQDLMSYLFGNILMVSSTDLWWIVGLDAVVLLAATLFYNQILAVCFDEEFARIRGINTDLYYLLMLVLTGLTVVILVDIVGVVLVIALLTLPAAVAGFFTRTLRQMMIVTSLLCATLTFLGLGISYSPNLPAGATIIVLAGIAYIAAVLWRRIASLRR